MKEPIIRVGVIGTGFVATHFLSAFDGRQGLRVTKVLTRRDLDGTQDFPRPELLTRTLEEVIEQADVIFECSGDAVHATDVIDAAIKASLPVVTMNPEFHVTAGSYFVGKGLVSECEGDQPGALASLHAFATEMGFRPLVYCNIKGFRNYTPTLEEMMFWSRKQNISLPMVTAATDGTKLQIEQALVANFLGTTIAQPGLIGPEDEDYRAAGERLAAIAKEVGPIVDYVLSPRAPHGVFLVAEHDGSQAAALEYFKLGKGPYYTILRHNIFVHLEAPRMIRRLIEQRQILMDNSALPTVSVVPIAKRRIAAGTLIDNGIGSFDVRGICVRIQDEPGALPIGLLQRAVLRRSMEPGAMLRFEDVDLEDSLALRAWQVIEQRALAKVGASPSGAVDSP